VFSGASLTFNFFVHVVIERRLENFLRREKKAVRRMCATNGSLRIPARDYRNGRLDTAMKLTCM
jgi:hypothetical protein